MQYEHQGESEFVRVNFKHVIHEMETVLQASTNPYQAQQKKSRSLDLTSGFEIVTFMVKKESQIQ